MRPILQTRSGARQYFACAGLAVWALLSWFPPAAWARDTATQDTATQDTATQDATRQDWVIESGAASYYGRAHQGRRTASGSRFDQKALTAAHPWLEFGTRVRVTLVGTGRSVVVVITDRLYSTHRVIDLSTSAARALGMLRQGVAEVALSPG